MPAVQLVEAYDQQTPRMTGTGPAAFSSSISTSTATAEPQRYYIDTDHLGTPQELTDSEGRLQWAGHYRAWGELAKATDSNGDAANVEMPLRFQGQYCDAETGLHYNRHRYYDPQLGRFTAQDPISLAGGVNLYQYAPNPVQWVDPLGLTAEDCPKPFIIFNKMHRESMPRPKGTGPNGGRLQSHHGLQQEWAKNNLSQYGYNASKAPSITLETGQGLPHTGITNVQNARRDARVAQGKEKWSSSLQDELGYINKDLGSAGFDKTTIDKVLEQQYSMLDKLGVPYSRI